MTTIENEADWVSYQDVFDDLWEAATIRLSLTDVDDYSIPNGEIVLHKESREEGAKTLYSIDGFEIIEKTVSDPFKCVRALFNNDLQVSDSPLKIDFRHLNSSGFFQTGIRESRVSDNRPRTEINTAFKPNLSDELEGSYNDAVNIIDQRIKTAAEPFFDLAKCEYYYFDYHFRGKSKADPMVLIFADPDIRFEVNSENELTTQLPIGLVDTTTIVVYPIQPYGEHSGWKIPLGELDLEENSEGLGTYTDSFDFDDIHQLYFAVYVEDKMMDYERHYNQNRSVVNDRLSLFKEYDQREALLDYLEGEKPNQFETAVLNLLGIAGYIVQWFGDTNFNIPNPPYDVPGVMEDEVDIIAHSPDGSHIIFVECTNQRISGKRDIVDRMESVTTGITGKDRIEFAEEPHLATRTIPCIATSQSPEDINNHVVEDLDDLGILVLHAEDLVSIYRASAEQEGLVEIGGDPGFWLRQRK